MDGRRDAAEDQLFPAYAGVILKKIQEQIFKKAFPRIRGGDPEKFASYYMALDFSPHTRG